MKIRSEVMKVAKAIEKEIRKQEENHKRWNYKNTKLERVDIVVSSINPKGYRCPRIDKQGFIKDLKDMVTYPSKQTLYTGIKW